MNEHIIFVISALHGGGAERVITTLANYMAGRGDDVTVLMTAGDEVVYRLEENVRLVSIGQASGGNPLVQLKRLAAMRRYFKAHRQSHIVSFSTRINLFTIIASLGLKMDVIVSERNDPDRFHYKWLRNMIYAMGNRFVFQTEDAADCFSGQIRARSHVIPNPIRTGIPEAYSGEREKKIAAAGRLEPQKNHKLLLEAFAGFHQRFPEYTLHIYGKGKLERELKVLASELHIESHVVWEGFREDILERIRTYGMYVLSSDYEGISNSLMEAMAMGLPCISTDCPIGGSRLCIQDGQNGRLIPPGDREALQRAMEWVAQDNNRAELMGQRAAGIRERFSEEKICECWRDFIGESAESTKIC